MNSKWQTMGVIQQSFTTPSIGEKMNDIKCPHCGKAFKIDESGYADILKQVRDSAFDQQLHDRLELAEKEKNAAVELAKAQITAEQQNFAALKDREIQELQSKINAGDIARQLAINEALSAVQKERDTLANELLQVKHEAEAAIKLEKIRLEIEVQKTAGTKNSEIQALKAKLEAIEVEKKLAITEAVSAVEKERDHLKSSLDLAELGSQLAEKGLKEKYETQIKDREDTIERLKDLKARLSTKMIGETLEQHCETEFNRVRSMAFPRAHFEKDNDARSGSKGDYIFREKDEGNTEVVSIMFEMKNESDTTTTKTKNEDFLKELDKDRVEKGCEYAIEFPQVQVRACIGQEPKH